MQKGTAFVTNLPLAVFSIRVSLFGAVAISWPKPNLSHTPVVDWFKKNECTICEDAGKFFGAIATGGEDASGEGEVESALIAVMDAAIKVIISFVVLRFSLLVHSNTIINCAGCRCQRDRRGLQETLNPRCRFLTSLQSRLE